MSKQEKPVHFEPHPVSPERKAELIGKGVRIVDAQFAPADWKGVEVDTQQPTAKQTIEELRSALAEAGVGFDPKAKKADLQALWDGVTKD